MFPYSLTTSETMLVRLLCIVIANSQITVLATNAPSAQLVNGAESSTANMDMSQNGP